MRIAAAGSPFGTRGISTIPAPRRPRLLVPVADPLREVRADRAAETLGVGEVVCPCVGALVAGAVPQNRSTRRRRSRRIPAPRISFRLPPLLDDQLLESVIARVTARRSDGRRDSRPAAIRLDANRSGSSPARGGPPSLRTRQPSLEFASAVKQALRELLVLPRSPQRRLDPALQRQQRRRIRRGDRPSSARRAGSASMCTRDRAGQHRLLGMCAHLCRQCCVHLAKCPAPTPSSRGHRANLLAVQRDQRVRAIRRSIRSAIVMTALLDIAPRSRRADRWRKPATAQPSPAGRPPPPRRVVAATARGVSRSAS